MEECVFHLQHFSGYAVVSISLGEAQVKWKGKTKKSIFLLIALLSWHLQGGLSFAFSIFCQWLLEKYDLISQIILLESRKKPAVDRFSIADIFQKFSAVPRDFKKIARIKVLTPLFISIFREASKNVYFVCSWIL